MVVVLADLNIIEDWTVGLGRDLSAFLVTVVVLWSQHGILPEILAY